jgi:hypothetical protein
MNVIDPVPALEDLAAAAAKLERGMVGRAAFGELRSAAANLAKIFHQPDGGQAHMGQVADGADRLEEAIAKARLLPVSLLHRLGPKITRAGQEIAAWGKVQASIARAAQP